MTFGFNQTPTSGEQTKYDHYLGKPVRIDCGNIGGTGKLLHCDNGNGTYDFILSPYIFRNSNGNAEIIAEERVTISTNHSPLSIYPLGRTLENYCREVNDAKNKENKESE